MEKREEYKGKLRDKRRRRMQRKRMQRMLLLSVILVSAGGMLAGGIKFAGWAGKAFAEYEKESKAKVDGADAFQAEIIEIKNNTKSKEEETRPGEAVKDRSDFAVTPEKSVGVYEESNEKVVYLTFDDGPSENTQAVMDILDQYDAKATFFVTGAQPEYAHMIKKAYEKGHTIGLHTYSHDYAAVYASVDAYFQDLERIGQMVQEQIGYVPCFIRFPGGSSNTVSCNYSIGIMTALSQEVLMRGYQYYDWNGSSGDGSVKTVEQLIAQGTSYTANNIVLLSHDSRAKETTVKALPAIMQHYQSQGYVFKALDRESYVPHHGISN